MLTSVYKYAAILGVMAALVIGAYFYGHHEGQLAGKAVLDGTVAKLNADASATLQAALNKQAIEDAAREKAAQDAVQAANQAKQDAQSNLTALQAKLRMLTDEPDKVWLRTPLPAGIRGLFNPAAGAGHQSSHSPAH